MTAETKDALEVIYWVITLGALCINIHVIRHSPINAVKVGRELNSAQQKDNAKRDLFLRLFAYRGSPAHWLFVECLNQIDVVFHDTPTVLTAWHKYYDSLQIKGQVNEEDIWRLLRVELLSQMAVALGYHQINQVDMAKNYYPQGHEYQNQTEWERQQTQLKYHKISIAFYQRVMNNMDANEKAGNQETSTPTQP